MAAVHTADFSEADDLEEIESTSDTNEETDQEEESKSKSDKIKVPKDITLKSQVVNIAIHPDKDIIACGKISGRVTIYSFARDRENLELLNFGNKSSKACRSVAFSNDGTKLFTTRKDKTISITDLDTGGDSHCIKNAHSSPVYTMKVISENILATGDDDGCVKLWDTRTNSSVAEFTDNTDYISGMDCERDSLVCTCGDGTLSVYNTRAKKLQDRSDEMDDELLSIAIVKDGQKVVCGDGSGTLDIYSWGRWGDISDRFPGHPDTVDTICKITENIVCTGCADGRIRSVYVQPSRFIKDIGQHGTLPVEQICLSSDGQLLASCSHDNIIKFWDVSELHKEMPEMKKKVKKKSRKRKLDTENAGSDNFFAEL